MMLSITSLKKQVPTSILIPISILIGVIFILLYSCSSSKNSEPTWNKTNWKKHIVDNTGSNTSSAVADDFDNDGHIDIMCSYDGKVVLYKGPNWTKKIVLSQKPEDWTGRIAKRGCIHSTLMDVDDDGDLDYIGSNRMLFWLECPENPFEDEWVCRVINLDVNGAHCVITADVDRDGKQDLIANSWRDKTESTIPNSITWFKTPKDPLNGKLWTPNVFADNDAPGRNHYMGFGDINKDGKGDIACAAPTGGWVAWWEQPEDPTKKWRKHLVSDNDPGATNVLTLDLNQDGDLDLLVTLGHEKGVIWFKGPTFEKIMIDSKIDKPHSLTASDIDGDGDIDFATCSSSLTGETAWYENDAKGNFTKHVIDTKQSSYDTRLIDMDGDEDLDILIGGQGSHNVVWYENLLK